MKKIVGCEIVPEKGSKNLKVKVIREKDNKIMNWFLLIYVFINIRSMSYIRKNMTPLHSTQIHRKNMDDKMLCSSKDYATIIT